MPQVSIVIPAFNPGDRLARAVESVRRQTFTDWDLVAVDDGGQEDLTWLDRLGDDRITLIRQPNRGVSVARNVGVGASGAPYLAFLDQDDEWLPEKLQQQMTEMQARDAGFSYTEFVWVSATGEVASVPSEIDYLSFLSGSQHICLSSVVVSRAAYVKVGGHDPLYAQMQDYDLFLRLLLVEERTAPVVEHLVRYRLHDSNASNDYETALAEALAIIAAHRRRAVRRGDLDLLAACDAAFQARRELFGYKAIDAARIELRRSPVAGLKHLGRAARLTPRATLSSVGRKVAGTARSVIR